MSAVINPTAAGGFVRKLRRRRGDIVLIGDSNAKRNLVSGHAQGMGRAWATALGCWGAAIMPAAGEENSWGSVAGDVAAGTAVGPAVDGDYSATPAGFQAAILPYTPAYGPVAADYFTNWAGASDDGGYSVRSQHPMRLTGSLRYAASVYIPAAGAAASVNPSVYTSAGVGTIIHPGSSDPKALPASEGFHTFTWNFELASDPTDGSGIGVRLQRFGGADLTGSFGVLYQSLERNDLYRGCRFSTFIFAGGESSRDVAAYLCNDCTDAALAEYLRFLASRQVNAGGTAIDPVLMVQIIEGGNDAGDTDSSVVYNRGDGFGNGDDSGNDASNTQAGITNNFKAIINRLRDIWVDELGYAEGDLYFVLGGYHPQAVSPQAAFVGSTMVAAMTAICADEDFSATVAGVDGYSLKTAEQFRDLFAVSTQAEAPTATVDESFYLVPSGGGLDEAHLTEHGYLAWGMVVVSALLESG
jgi:hypothetical protein